MAKGTFAKVYMSTIAESGNVVAVKKQAQNKKYKNRELAIMKELENHPNVIKLQHAFFTMSEKSKDSDSEDEGASVLNIVMDFIPMTIGRVVESFKKLKQPLHPILVKLYSYQLLRGLAFIHSEGVLHRDIKPANLLIDPTCHVLKICDFGSAKRWHADEESIPYICSRYYRAPELIFGAKQYDYKIDVWSAGCVIAEMLGGSTLFKGTDGFQQLLEIVKKLGTPTEHEVAVMNPDYAQKPLPKVIGQGFE